MSEAQLRERIELLEAEIANLHEQMRVVPEETFILNARRILALPPGPCKVLWQLLDGKPKSREAIFSAMYANDLDPPLIRIIDVLVCKLRRGLDPYEITVERVWGYGYQMEAKYCQYVRELLAPDNVEAQP